MESKIKKKIESNNYKNASKALTFALALILIIMLSYNAGYSAYSSANSNTTQIIYRTEFIKPGNATIIAYYSQPRGYSLMSISIKGVNTSLNVNYNNYNNVNSIATSIAANQINSSASATSSSNTTRNASNVTTLPAQPYTFPHYAAAFTELEPLSQYNITVRYSYEPPCLPNKICTDVSPVSPSFILVSSVSEVVKTGLNGSITTIYFFGNST